MSELKTLKDLSAENMCCQQRLRFEAIKWIKEFDAQIRENREAVPYKVSYIQDWIKHFFNISEEDLA